MNRSAAGFSQALEAGASARPIREDWHAGEELEGVSRARCELTAGISEEKREVVVTCELELIPWVGAASAGRGNPNRKQLRVDLGVVCWSSGGGEAILYRGRPTDRGHEACKYV